MAGTGIDVKLGTLIGEATETRGAYDLQLNAQGDIATEDAFDTAMLVSLFTDARALPSQVALPERRRGWIGDERTPGEQMGGLLWLFQMQRLTRSVANEIEDAAEQALAWMVTEEYAVTVNATATISSEDRLTLEILVTKPSGDVEARLFELWSATGKTFLEPV